MVGYEKETSAVKEEDEDEKRKTQPAFPQENMCVLAEYKELDCCWSCILIPIEFVRCLLEGHRIRMENRQDT